MRLVKSVGHKSLITHATVDYKCLELVWIISACSHFIAIQDKIQCKYIIQKYIIIAYAYLLQNKCDCDIIS